MYFARRHREDATHIDQRSQRTVLEPEGRDVLPLAIHHGILEKCEGWKTGQAIVGQDMEEVSIDMLCQRRIQLLPQRSAAVHGTEIE